MEVFSILALFVDGGELCPPPACVPAWRGVLVPVPLGSQCHRPSFSPSPAMGKSLP